MIEGSIREEIAVELVIREYTDDVLEKIWRSNKSEELAAVLKDAPDEYIDFINKSANPEYSLELVSEFGEEGCKVSLKCSDEILETISKAENKSEIINFISRFEDAGAEIFAKYGDDAIAAVKGCDASYKAVEALTKVPTKECAETIIIYGDDAVNLLCEISTKECVEVISKYGPDVIGNLKGLREDAVKIISSYGDDAVKAIESIGTNAVSAVNKCNNKAKAIQILNDFDVKIAADALRKGGDEVIEALEKYTSKDRAVYLQLMAKNGYVPKLIINGGQKTVDAVINLNEKYVDNFMRAVSSQKTAFLSKIEHCSFTDDAVKLIGRYNTNAREIQIFDAIHDKNVFGLSEALDSNQTTITFAFDENSCFVETSGTRFKRNQKGITEDFFNGLDPNDKNGFVRKYSEVFTEEFVNSMDVDDSIKNELRALNNAIEGTREFAKSEGKLYGEDFDYPGPPEYSRVKAWTVYNCDEVWSAREAILNGAKFDELKFTSIWKSDGTKNAMCDNCQITFAGKEYIFTGD